jgi:hypothetical protein
MRWAQPQDQANRELLAPAGGNDMNMEPKHDEEVEQAQVQEPDDQLHVHEYAEDVGVGNTAGQFELSAEEHPFWGWYFEEQ